MFSSCKICVLSCIVRVFFGSKSFFIKSSECFTLVTNIPGICIIQMSACIKTYICSDVTYYIQCMPIMTLFAALGINYARQGVARQTKMTPYADRAIDGKTGGPSNHANCLPTGLRNNPWWAVYFRKVISVSVVIIHNRFDWRGKYLLWYYCSFF